MPTYIFKDAAGKRYKVDADDGVSEGAAYESFSRAVKAPAAKSGGVSNEAMQMATDGMGWGQRALENVGAGVDTVWQGARSLFGNLGDAELGEQRRLKSGLADSTTGGGALQFLGEVLPSLAVPAGGFVRGAQMAGRGVGTVARALGGMEAAAPQAAATVARLGTGAAAGDAALAGALSGALQPVASDESRGLNVGLGAAGGAILPGVVAGAKKGIGALTRSGAGDRAASKLIDALGGQEGAQDAVAAVRGYKPGAFVSDVPMSVSEILQNPKIAGLERNSRMTFKEDWANLTAAQAESRYNALRDATGGADDLTRLIDSRAAATDPMRAKALTAAQKDLWFHEPVGLHLAELMSGEAGADPAVKKIAGYVAGELDNGITPEKLYRVRKVLADRLAGPAAIGDEMSAAAKAAQADTLGIIKSIDASLDKASGGKWSPYMERYAQESKPVTSAKAQQGIRDIFEREGAAMTAGLSGSVPEITGRRLGAAIDKTGSNAFGDTLDYGTRDALAQLQENIGRSELLQKLLKNTGTAGGGSNSPMDLMSNVVAQNRISRGGQAIHWITQRSKNLTQGALSDALQNPDLFVRAVEGKLARGAPLTQSEEAVLVLVRGATAATLPAALAQ